MFKLELPGYGIADLYCTYIPKHQFDKTKKFIRPFNKDTSFEDSHRNLITIFCLKTNMGYIPVKNIKGYHSLFNPLKYCKPIKVIKYSNVKDKTGISDKTITSLEAKLGDKWQSHKKK